ncbi:MAG: shikimate kinase [Butyricimonas faecalis]
MAEVRSMKYFIVGYMASGSPRSGRSWPRIRTSFSDWTRVLKHGRTVDLGNLCQRREVYFREREREILHEICNERMNSCWRGRGTPFFDNMDYMNQEGTTVFLNTSPLVIVDRLKRQRTDRPLLAKCSDDELEFLSGTSGIPASLYLKAKERYNIRVAGELSMSEWRTWRVCGN